MNRYRTSFTLWIVFILFMLGFLAGIVVYF